jgi:2-dehydro-3-deoxyphosphogluconate aldolase/(4S)-4-hydroxy-2-oxoglutarate aldolase
MILKEIERIGIVAVVRAETAEQVKGAVKALLEGGISAVEITFTVPNAIEMIRQTKKEYGECVLLGAGTVLSPANAAGAMGAGAQYIVSPHTNADIIRLCNKEGIAVMPGAMTPTEVVTAWSAGADIVKLFPAEFLGPKYVKALRAPLPDVRLMPTGGVSPENVAEWLAAGATALGAGGNLVDKNALKTGKFEVITQRAREFVTAVQNYRKG